MKISNRSSLLIQTSALVLLTALPKVALAQDLACDDTVLPIPTGCERLNAGNTVAVPVAPNTENDVPSGLGAGGFSISIDNVTVAGVPAPVIPERAADLALARSDVDVMFDGLDTRRLLNVSTVDQGVSYRAGDVVTFRSSANYPAYIARSEVVITDQSRPGQPVIETIAIPANGQADWVMPADGEGQYAYQLKVYDRIGRADETQPLALRRTSNVEAVGAAPFVVAGEGEDRTRIRRIPASGGAVTVSGIGTPGGTVRIMGEDVPVDSAGRFAVSRILPAGDHVVVVETPGGTIRRDINVPASDWFHVGIVDITAGRRLGGARDVDESYINGRLAFYVKGTTESGYRITGSLDTRDGPIEDIFTRLNDKDTRRVLDRLRDDPSDGFVTFGDDSVSFDDTPTSGSIYLRVENDTTRLTFGDFTAGVTGPGLLNNTRSLYGAELRYQSANVTGNGDARFAGMIYAAQQDTVGQRDVLRGTGGSVYFLSRQDITGGSVQLSVQTRDPVTGLIVDQRDLVEGVDFTVDHLQGVVKLLAPLNSSASDDGIISDGAGEFDVNLIAQYEFTPTTGLSDATAFGGRGEVWVTDTLRLGATAMQEQVNGDDQQTLGVDLHYRLGENSFAELEVAQSDGPGFDRSSSTDGGLTILSTGGAGADQAQALRFNMQTELTDLGLNNEGSLGLYYEQKDAGFTTIHQTIDEDQTLIGADLSFVVSDGVELSFSAEHFEKEGGTERTKAEAEVSVDLNEVLTLEAAVALLEQTTPGDASETGSRTDVGLRLNYSPSDDLTLYGFGQATVARDGGLSDNNRFGLGTVAQLGDKVTLSAEFSDGDTGTGATARLSYSIAAGQEAYVGYTLDPTRSGAGSRLSDNGTIVLGGRAQLTETISIFTETVFDAPGNQRSLSQAYGVTYTPQQALTLSGSMETGRIRDAESGDFDRFALSFGAAYTPSDDLSIRGRLEYRTEDGDGTTRDRDTFGLTAGYANQVADDWRLLADLDAFVSDSAEGAFRDGEYVRASLGYAYRPIDNERLNVLLSYTALRDLPGEDQVNGNGDDDGPLQRSQILSVAANYDLNRYLTLGGKLGYRMGEVAPRGTEDFTSSTATLAAVRLDWHVVNKWDILGEGRVLYTEESETLERGALVGVYRHMTDSVKLGVGYEWGDVSDDAADIEYDSQGLFLNIVGKF